MRDSRYTAGNVKISDLPKSGLRVAFFMVVLIWPATGIFGSAVILNEAVFVTAETSARKMPQGMHGIDMLGVQKYL